LPNFSKAPLVVNYPYDGKGRDTFIGENNGGFAKQGDIGHNFFKRLRMKETEEDNRRKKYQNSEIEDKIKKKKITFPDALKKICFPNMIERLSKPMEKSETR
jgi:hypothetical protein